MAGSPERGMADTAAPATGAPRVSTTSPRSGTPGSSVTVTCCVWPSSTVTFWGSEGR